MKQSVLLAATALVFACPLSAETVPPTVLSASVAPSPVDVTSAAQNVTATFHITDAGSGVDYGNGYLYDPSGKFVTLVFIGNDDRTSGDSHDATYSVNLTVPRYSQPGLWRVDAFFRDHDGNQVTFDPNQTPFPDPQAMKFTVVNSGPVDNSTPTLDSSSVSPPAVDTSSGPATVTFTVGVSDTVSGFDFGFVNLIDPDGIGRYEISPYYGDGSRTSGDANHGVYVTSVNLPQNSKAGTWTYTISGKDKTGNDFNSAVQGSFTVASTPLPPPPSNFLAQAVDAVQFPWASTGGGWVIQSKDSYDNTDAAASQPLADDASTTIQTTITGPGELSFQWRVDSEEDADFLSVSVDGGEPVESISGDTGWQQVIVNLPPGEHAVTWTYAKDGSFADGEDRGWLDEVRFVADDDLELPVLQSLEISPRLADISDGGTDVEFTISVTDDFNGIAEGRIELFDPNGNPQVSTNFDNGSNSGDSLDAHWQLSLPLAETAEHGLWRAEITLTEDVSNATRRYGNGADPFPAKRIEYFYVGSPGDGDPDVPLLQDISVTPGTVDITNGTTTTTVTLQVTDSVKGFSYGEAIVYNPDENRTGYVLFESPDRVSGDKFNGIYEVQVPIPAYGKPGTWTIGVRLTDEGGNSKEYPYDVAYPVDIDPSFHVVNSGAVDLTTPVITSIDISPGTVNTSGGPAQVQVTVSIGDDLSGVLEAYAYFFDPADVFQNDLFVNISDYRLSGNDSAGVYQFTKTLPQGSAPGQWRVAVFLRDKAGNAVYYGQDAAPYPEAGDGYFTIGGAVPSVFAAYVAGFGLTGNDALPAADPDHDGLNNALEALLGSNPTNSASAGAGLISISRDATHFYLNFMVSAGLTVTTDGNFLKLGNGSGGAPLSVAGQTQTKLTANWSMVLPEHVSGRNYRIGIPLSGNAQGFARLFFEGP
ncbi:hypothetical protein [Haloferula sp. BvORR071]|uniref:DUF7035 domain-containing protein n=1 Tax=Haloferula sp. BvORR071 TaxID=1396141 RepID=UPI0005539058|nr:hypothetical protein [Haloferula sp. BvORR071]